MPVFFWVDVIAYAVSALVALSMALMVLGIGPNRGLNRAFAAFCVMQAISAVTSCVERALLALNTGNPALWLEMAALSFTFMAPFLLMFAARLFNRPTRWIDRIAVLGLAINLAAAFPLFQHKLITPPQLDAYGMAVYSLKPAVLPLMVMSLGLFVWVLVIFWRERRRVYGVLLALSVASLLLGYVLAVGLRFLFPFPFVSVAGLLSVSILSYAVISRQLLNPLRELTADLERKVDERTHALAESAAQLETANQTLRRRSGQLEAVAQVAREAAAIQDVGQLLQQAVASISERFGFHHTAIYLLDGDKENVTLYAASSEEGQRLLDREQRFKVDEMGALGVVARSNQASRMHDVNAGSDFFGNLELPGTRSRLVLPLRARGRVVGVLDAQSGQVAAFGEEDVPIFNMLADQLALAIDNALLLLEMQVSMQELEVAYGRYTEETWRAVNREKGKPSGYRYRRSAVEPAETLYEEVRQAWELGRPVNTTLEGDISGQDGAGIHVVAIPIRLRDQVIGVLDLRSAGAPIPGEAISLVEEVTNRLALSLESARLLQETQQQAAHEEMVGRITNRIRMAGGVDGVLRATVQELRRALGVSHGAIRLGVHGPHGPMALDTVPGFGGVAEPGDE